MSRIFTVTTADKTSAVNGTIEIRVSGPKVSNVIRYEIHRESSSTPTTEQYNGQVIIHINTGSYSVDFFNLWVADNREVGGSDSAIGTPLNATETIEDILCDIGKTFTIEGNIAPSANSQGEIPLTKLNYTFDKEIIAGNVPFETGHCTIKGDRQGELTLDDYNPMSNNSIPNLAGIPFNFEIIPTAKNFVVALEITV